MKALEDIIGRPVAKGPKGPRVGFARTERTGIPSVSIRGRSVPVQTGPFLTPFRAVGGPSISVVGASTAKVNPVTGKLYSQQTGSSQDTGYLDYLTGDIGGVGGGGVQDLREQLDQYAGFKIPTWAYIAVTGGIVYWWTNRKKGKK